MPVLTEDNELLYVDCAMMDMYFESAVNLGANELRTGLIGGGMSDLVELTSSKYIVLRQLLDYS